VIDQPPNKSLERTRISMSAIDQVVCGPLSSSVIAPREARRILQGESPCRVRASHPPVSSLASVAESREGRTRQAKRRQSILEAVGESALAFCAGTARDELG
jgi:hypothetical protein